MRQAVRVGLDGRTRTIRRHDVEGEGTALAARGLPGSSSGATAHSVAQKLPLIEQWQPLILINML